MNIESLTICLFTKSFFLENVTNISSQKNNGLLLNSDEKIEDISKHIHTFKLNKSKVFKLQRWKTL